MSLDKRLKKYYYHDPDELGEDAFKSLSDTHIEAIKQAFIDEGWVQVKYAPGSRYEFPMTGPEWLARFEKKLIDINGNGKLNAIDFMYLEAARRASGVDAQRKRAGL